MWSEFWKENLKSDDLADVHHPQDSEPDRQIWNFLKSASGLVPDGWVGLNSFGYRCHFRAFQLELDTLDTQNIGNGSVVAKLQLFEVEQSL